MDFDVNKIREDFPILKKKIKVKKPVIKIAVKFLVSMALIFKL